MERITIETTQNVGIEHNIASVGERIAATLLDGFFLFAYILLAISIISFFDIYGTALLVVVYVPYLTYHFLCETLFQGQSPAKKILNLKVVKADGTEPTIGSYFIRWIFRIVDIVLTMGVAAILSIVINGRGQRLGDMVAGTTVIKLGTPNQLRDTLYMQLPEGYSLVFNEIIKLTDADINIVNEVYRQLRSGKNDSTEQLAYRAKQELERKMGIVSELSPNAFILTVLRDYTFMHRNSEF